MYYSTIIVLIAVAQSNCFAQTIYETELNFRVEPGSKTCFFQKGKTGQMMELYYQVLDGQHGDLDISVDVVDPNAGKIVSEYKKSQNSIIMDLELDGDYGFCLDNTFSVINSKLVFVYVLIEENGKEAAAYNTDAEVVVIDVNGEEHKEEEVLEWSGTDDQGEAYYLEVTGITDSLSRTLKFVVKARHLLDIYGASKSRDSYIAFEDTFVVDVWSGLQITLMLSVGMLQVYMIKKLFNGPCTNYTSVY